MTIRVLIVIFAMDLFPSLEKAIGVMGKEAAFLCYQKADC
jgi:hypothetical protein